MRKSYDREMLISKALIESELAVSRQHLSEARDLPGYGLWQKLVSEEVKHTRRIELLSDGLKVVFAHADEPRRRSHVVRWLIQLIKAEVVRIHRQVVPVVYALSISAYIENDFRWKHFFEIYKSDSPVLRRVLEDLNADTRDRVSRVTRAWTHHIRFLKALQDNLRKAL